jgi:hypothetical protein
MKHDTADERWQELHVQIEQFRRKYLSVVLPAIEYKPQEVLHLLEMPSKYVEKYSEVK